MREILQRLVPSGRQAFLPLTLIRSGGLPLAAWNAFVHGMPDWVAMEAQQESARVNLYELLNTLLHSLPGGDLRTHVYNARKALFRNKNIPPSLRKQFPETGPEWTELSRLLQQWDDVHQFRKTCEKDLDLAIKEGFGRLGQIARDPVILSGLLYASHDLRECMVDLGKKESAEWNSKDNKAAKALLQYFTRTVFKTSPFSVFTTLSVQSFSDGGRERVGDWFEARAMVTPNVAFLPYFYDVLLEDASFRDSLTVRINPSSRYFSEGTYEWLYFDGTSEAFQQLPAQPMLDYLWKILSGMGKAPSFLQLSKLIEAEIDEEPEAVQGWLLRLIDLGFLEWLWPEKGLGSGWCGGLYQYLGYIPSSDRTLATAQLLQWLRTTARTLPFQEPSSVAQVQKEALAQIQSYFSGFGVEPPPLSAEQVFYEDVYREVQPTIPGEVLEQLVEELNTCWHSRASHLLPDFRADLVNFARQELGEKEDIAFLDFCRRFMSAGKGVSSEPLYAPRYHGKIGAVVQPYFEDGQYKAVVNGLYAGCGKMYARFWSQLAPQESEWVSRWIKDTEETVAPYPFPGWSNVHFQPTLFSGSLVVPDGRLNPGTGWNLPLRDLRVKLNSEDMPELWNPENESPIILNDLGLESPELLPPVRRILWYLGVPFVS
ncbi:MAG: lantibiotic dehydratase, partial [Saprospiraceae bacterium]|nr:lantibiotic dehydratase [Saprospiraceae bacterium]